MRLRALLCCAVLLTPTSCDREVGGGIDDLSVVVSPPAGWSLDYPTYSPDGKRLIAMAFDSHADLRLTLLRDDRLEPLDMARDLVDYAWMPDSRSLLLATGKPMGPSVLQVVDLAGRLQSRVDLGTDIILAQSGMSVSADGRFAFVSALADRGLDEQDLFRVDLRSGKIAALTTTSDTVESFPVVREDGEVIYVATSGDRRDSVVLSSTGGKITQVSPADLWVDRVSDTSFGLVVTGFPTGQSLAWRGYRLAPNLVEIPGTKGLRWVTGGSDRMTIAGVLSGDVDSGGQLVIVPIEPGS